MDVQLAVLGQCGGDVIVAVRKACLAVRDLVGVGRAVLVGHGSLAVKLPDQRTAHPLTREGVVLGGRLLRQQFLCIVAAGKPHVNAGRIAVVALVQYILRAVQGEVVVRSPRGIHGIVGTGNAADRDAVRRDDNLGAVRLVPRAHDILAESEGRSGRLGRRIGDGFCVVLQIPVIVIAVGALVRHQQIAVLQRDKEGCLGLAGRNGAFIGRLENQRLAVPRQRGTQGNGSKAVQPQVAELAVNVQNRLAVFEIPVEHGLVHGRIVAVQHQLVQRTVLGQLHGVAVMRQRPRAFDGVVAVGNRQHTVGHGVGADILLAAHREGRGAVAVQRQRVPALQRVIHPVTVTACIADRGGGSQRHVRRTQREHTQPLNLDLVTDDRVAVRRPADGHSAEAVQHGGLPVHGIAARLLGGILHVAALQLDGSRLFARREGHDGAVGRLTGHGRILVAVSARDSLAVHVDLGASDREHIQVLGGGGAVVRGEVVRTGDVDALLAVQNQIALFVAHGVEFGQLRVGAGLVVHGQTAALGVGNHDAEVGRGGSRLGDDAVVRHGQRRGLVLPVLAGKSGRLQLGQRKELVDIVLNVPVAVLIVEVIHLHRLSVVGQCEGEGLPVASLGFDNQCAGHGILLVGSRHTGTRNGSVRRVDRDHHKLLHAVPRARVHIRLQEGGSEHRIRRDNQSVRRLGFAVKPAHEGTLALRHGGNLRGGQRGAALNVHVHGDGRLAAEEGHDVLRLGEFRGVGCGRLDGSLLVKGSPAVKPAVKAVCHLLRVGGQLIGIH